MLFGRGDDEVRKQGDEGGKPGSISIVLEGKTLRRLEYGHVVLIFRSELS